MKVELNSTRPFFRALRASIFLGAALVVQAQTPNFTVSNFDTEDEIAAWSRWWGGAQQTYEFDATTDAGNNANSGSLKATIEFDLATAAGDNQFALVGGFPENATIDATQYTNLVFDLRWDPSSPKRAAGDFGTLEPGLRRADFSQYWFPPMTVPATAGDGWMRVTLPINPAGVGLDAITGVALKMWSGDANNGFTGTATFWIDNVHFVGRTDTEVPAPRMSIEEAQPGLQVFASGSGQYQRQNIRTVNPAYSWVGASGPVTYSFTVTDYPTGTNSGFQTHLFLVPGSSVPNFEASPDWNQPNVVFFELQNAASGEATATFRYKTNSPNGNAMYYNANPETGPAGALASISNPDARGKWSLTFANDNNVTITTPSGSSTNFALPSGVAELFADPMYAYLGIQPNRLENLGESASFSRFEITGVATPITETFAGVVPDPENNPDAQPNLDPAIWERVAESAAGIILVPQTADYWVKWTAPAAGFKLQATDNLATANWVDVTATATQIGTEIRAAVPATGNRGFYRLVKP